MKYYADTGFILSLHLLETTSSIAAGTMQSIAEPLPISALVALEFRNALRLAVFRKNITESERLIAWTTFQKDAASGLMEPVETEFRAVFTEAESMCDQFTGTTGVRTLDLLHVATARILGRTHFLSFDNRQRAMALSAGMTVLP